MYQLKIYIGLYCQRENIGKFFAIFIKTVVFQHVGLFLIIKSKEQLNFDFSRGILLSFNICLGIIEQSIHIGMALTLKIFYNQTTKQV